MPMYCGCPSMSTITCPEPPLSPRIDMVPAAPSETPYPMIPREVMKRPGTCSVSTGSSDGTLEYSINGRSTTLTVMGRCRISVSLRVPVTTTSESVSVRTFPEVSAGTSKQRASARTDAAAHINAAASTNIFLIVQI